MKVRRIKRRKVPTLPTKNEEDTAQDNLFEISNFMEEWAVDESQVLLAPSVPVQPSAKQSAKRTLSAVKRSVVVRNCNFQEDSRVQRIHHERFVPLATRNYERATHKVNQLIYNSLQSNNVFVGQKSDERPLSKGHNCILLGHQKTPKGYSLPHTVNLNLKAKTEPSQERMSLSHFSMGRSDPSWMNILQLSGGNRLYGKVKQTMRRELEGWLRQ